MIIVKLSPDGLTREVWGYYFEHTESGPIHVVLRSYERSKRPTRRHRTWVPIQAWRLMSGPVWGRTESPPELSREEVVAEIGRRAVLEKAREGR